MKQTVFCNVLLALVLLASCGLAGSSFGATIIATSCAQAAVQSAINAAAEGDVIVVPNGNCTWASGVSISGKGLHLKGETIGGVTLTHSAGASALIRIQPDATNSVEISGLRFMPGSVADGAFYMAVDGIGRPVLVHDLYMRVVDFGVSCIHWGARGGVLWNNEFESLNSGGAGSGCIPIKAESAEFDVSWTSKSTFGADDVNGDQNVYIENNTFRKIINQALDPDGNARIVVRYNTFDNSAMASHGADTGPDGMRHAELYNNTFVFSTSGTGYNFPLALNNWMYIRGGSWVITDNVLPNISSQMWGNKTEIAVTVQNLKRAAGPYPCWTTYPVPHQFGQGYDTAPVVEPAYIWNNTGGGVQSPGLTDYSPNQCSSNLSVSQFVQEGRDYFVGVAKPGYRKYTYPHPLRGAELTPRAPTALRAD